MVAQTLVGSTRSTIINRYAVTTLDPLIPNSFYSPQETRTGFKLLHQIGVIFQVELVPATSR